MSTRLHKNPEPPRVAIACQGGGSHTAFTAGALKTIVRRAETGRYRIAALSGTSGGAICALLTWYGLVKHAAGSWTTSQTVALLDDFWRDNSALLPSEKAWNDWIVATVALQGQCPQLESSPYSPQRTLLAALLDSATPRKEFLDLEALLRKHLDPNDVQEIVLEPRLLIGAVEVRSGEFAVFDSWQTGERGISIDAVLASAALPLVFRAVEIGGGAYWDGLFSQNPPIRPFIQGLKRDEKPAETWVSRINPQERSTVPTSVEAIEDRRNELAGNLSLNQELAFVYAVNAWLAEGVLIAPAKKQIAVRTIEISDELSSRLDYASKLNRDPQLIADLINDGEKRAAEFLDAL